ncbi:MAG: transcription antitermination factor NusB [Rhodospirillales bacterium]
MGIDNPRRVALQTLDACLGRKFPLDRAFEEAATNLEGRDRAFVRALVATTLRRLGQIDSVFEKHLKRPIPKKALTARNILRLGVAQLLFLKTPAHAAVGETTALATSRATANYKGLINAVLRRVAEAGVSSLQDQDAARLNTPGWLWESWVKSYGRNLAYEIASAHMTEAPLDLTIFAKTSEKWAEILEGELLPTGTVRRSNGGRIESMVGYHDGAWAPQDAAAALPALLFGEVTGKQILDLCAAPGGKTAQLAAAGAYVTAVDANERRLNRLKANLQRLELTAKTVVADVLDWRPKTPVQGVLLDVPCSSTGTIRRHPDLPWIKSTSEVKALLPIQAQMLQAASEMLEPGGLLIYACCSLQPEEGERQVQQFLKNHHEFSRQTITASDLPGIPEAITSAGDLRTHPAMWGNKGGIDGFFAARLRKNT